MFVPDLNDASVSMSKSGDFLALAQWRRMVAQIYADVRCVDVPEAAWQQFLAARNALFKTHAQSPLDEGQRAVFSELPFFAYDPDYRVVGKLDLNVPQEQFCLELAADGEFRYRRVATVLFAIKGQTAQLSLFWIEGYGGGLFLPFKDLTSKTETFGAGRYLYDTIKGADLGVDETKILLDFNFAYNPSCAYNDQWVCPLAPLENSLNFPILAGEKKFM